MFLAATARPHYDPHTKTYWNGKIGMWECMDYVAAKRTSRNRPAGTIKAKPYNIDGLHYKSLILDKVLPTIASKCPLGMKSKAIYIQHDNVPPHKSVLSSCPELVEKTGSLVSQSGSGSSRLTVPI